MLLLTYRKECFFPIRLSDSLKAMHLSFYERFKEQDQPPAQSSFFLAEPQNQPRSA